jgi:uncharacterized protein
MISEKQGKAAMVTDADYAEQAKTRNPLNRRQVLFIILTMAGITLAQYIYAYQTVSYGIAISIVLVITIYVLASVLRLDARITRSIESIALIPLYVIFTSCLPWFFISQQFLLPAVYACILGLCIWHIYRNGLSLTGLLNFDRRKLLKYCIIALVIGIPTGTIEYLILRPAPAAPAFSTVYFLRDVVYMLLFVGFGEELLFRGLIQKDLIATFGWRWGLLGTAFLFAIMHMTWRSVPELFFVFGAALILGGLYIRTKSLIAPILFHAVNNIMLASVAPYLFPK